MTESRIIPDDTYPAMFRIHWADGVISGMANLARCRDAVHEYEKGAIRREKDRRYELKHASRRRQRARG